MAHFAKVENNIVTNVIAVDVDGEFPDSEATGKIFIASLGLDGNWLQTCKSRSFRGNFAGKGMTYSTTLDCFHPNSPYPSWILDSNGKWNAPVEKPSDDHYWNEDNLEWVADA